MYTATELEYVKAAYRDDTATVRRLETELDQADRDRLARLTNPTALAGAALWYAEQGIAVFPCQQGDKRPATANGFKDATTDPQKIAAWWTANPQYNIGVPTGHQFDVFDVDGPSGMVSLGEYFDTGQFPDAIGLAFTPRGRHYYVTPNPEARNTTHLLPQVDYRGLGGYVIAPPSRTPAGIYRWQRPLRLPATAAAA